MIGEQNERKTVYINKPTYYIVREWGNEGKRKTIVVSGAYTSKENALKECDRRKLELDPQLIGDNFKVVKIVCNITEED